MHRFILQFPISILAILFFAWLFFYFGKIHLPDEWLMVHTLLFLAAGCCWQLSLNTYLNHALERKEFDLLSIFIIFQNIPIVYDILTLFTGNPISINQNLWIERLTILLFFSGILFLSIKTKKVFYERTGWFIFLELFFYPVGILTLTPEIRNHYIENKAKMDKIFAGGSDEEILNP